MAQAEIRLEILEDGTIKWETGRIPAEHHDDADLLQAELEKALGGEVQRTSKVAKGKQVQHKQETHERTSGN
jgi:hypothetical protein